MKQGRPRSRNKIWPRVLRTTRKARPLMIIFKRLWRSGEIPEDWKKINVIPVFKKGKEEDPGKYLLVSFTSIPRKVVEHHSGGHLSPHE